MTGYLVDASVTPAFARRKPAVPQSVVDWLRARTAEPFLPTVVVAEMDQGVCKLRRQRSRARPDALTRWLDELVQVNGARVLPSNIVAMRLAGQIADSAVAAGRHPGFGCRCRGNCCSEHACDRCGVYTKLCCVRRAVYRTLRRLFSSLTPMLYGLRQS